MQDDTCAFPTCADHVQLDGVQGFKIVERKKNKGTMTESHEWGWYEAGDKFNMNYVVVEANL